MWTNHDLIREFPKEPHLSGALVQIEKKLAEKSCVVCEIFVDDEKISEESEESLNEIEVADVGQLKVSYLTVQKLVSSSLLSVGDMIPKITSVCHQTAHLIHESEHHQASQFIVQIMESCYWLTQTLVQLKGLFIVRGAEYSRVDWECAEADLHQSVKDMLSALENGDFVLIADYLDCHLPQILNRWLVLSRSIEEGVCGNDTQGEAAESLG
jgi:hypothetical protein